MGEQKVVDKYLLTTLLGRGNYGSVYRAKDMTTEFEYAVKAIPLATIFSKGLEQLCIQEITAMRNVQSPYIVALHDFKRTKNNLYLVMDLCAGQSLDKIRGGFDKTQIKRWLLNIVEAFIVLQDADIIHRDLKLENVLLSHEDPYQAVAKVCDFGFATWGNVRWMRNSRNAGSLLYMAPELFSTNEYNNKVDVWSFGVLVDQLLDCGLFNISTVQELHQRHTEISELIVRADLPIDTKGLLQATLHPDPNARLLFRDIRTLNFFEGVSAQPMQAQIPHFNSSVENYSPQRRLIDLETRLRRISSGLMEQAQQQDSRNHSLLACAFLQVAQRQVHQCLTEIQDAQALSRFAEELRQRIQANYMHFTTRLQQEQIVRYISVFGGEQYITALIFLEEGNHIEQESYALPNDKRRARLIEALELLMLGKEEDEIQRQWGMMIDPEIPRQLVDSIERITSQILGSLE